MPEPTDRLAEFDWRDEPRVPAGEAGGGRWVAEGASTAGETFAAPIHNFKAKSGPATAAEVNALRSHLHSLTTAQLKRLAAKHDVPAAGRDKARLVSELHQQIVAHREGAAQPAAQPLGHAVVYTEGKDAGLESFRPTKDELLKIWAANPAMTDKQKRESLVMRGVDPASAAGKSILEAAGVKAAAPSGDEKVNKSAAVQGDKANREQFRAAAVHLLDFIGHRYEARRLEQGFIPRKLHPSTAQHLLSVAERFGVTLPAHVHQAAAAKSSVRYTPGFHEAAEFADVPLFAAEEIYGRLASFADEGAGHWVTMGAHGAEGDKHGGTPVYIQNGKITKGPASVVGKSPSELGKKIKQDHGPLHPHTGTKEGPVGEVKAHVEKHFGKKTEEKSATPVDKSQASRNNVGSGETKPQPAGDTKMETATKAPHEMTKAEWDEAIKTAGATWQDKVAAGFLSAGTGGSYEKGLEMAIEKGHKVPEEFIGKSARLIAADAVQKMKAAYGDDWKTKLSSMRAAPIHEVLRRNEDGSLTVRQKQNRDGSFAAHTKGQVVIEGGKPMIVAKAGKGYKQKVDGYTTAYAQDIALREPKKSEEDAARRAVDADKALSSMSGSSGNESYPDLKRKQVAEWTELVHKALGIKVTAVHGEKHPETGDKEGPEKKPEEKSATPVDKSQASRNNVGSGEATPRQEKPMPTALGKEVSNKTYYHGTWNKDAEMDPAKNPLGVLSFTDDETHAEGFGDTVHKVRLEIRNPIDLRPLGSGSDENEEEGVSVGQVEELLAEHGIRVDLGKKKDRKSFTSNLFRKAMPEIKRQAIKNGYDGLLVLDYKDHEVEEAQVFHKDQIKVVGG